jgi:MEMO1 family protein
MSVLAEIRPSPIAGTWYEANPSLLARQVDDYLAKADLPTLPGQPVAVIAPHAGHRYSGAVAGYAFAAIRHLTPEIIAVVSPMHRAYLDPLITTAHSAYGTPLGKIPVANELIADLDQRLIQRLGFGLTPVANDPEHSLEIELPFLQRAVKASFSLLPVMIHAQDTKISRHLGEALAETLTGKNALLVASTDLSHFHPVDTANRLDAALLAQVEAFSPEGVFEVEKQGKGEACGLGALAAVLWAAKALGGRAVRILNHATSGDITGDYHDVVGYGAAVVLKP